MEKLRKKRTPLRTSFTKTLNVLKAEIAEESFDRGSVSDGFSKLEILMQEIKTLDDSLIDLMADDDKCDEDSINKEIEEMQNYSDAFITLKRKVNEVLNVNKLNSNDIMKTSEYDYSKSKRYKLPKLNIKPFDSQLINYLSFWSAFEKIHEDPDLDDCDKFQYLLQSVEPGTRARQLLESYPITGINYSKAVAAFQERFGNTDLLIEVYVREFLKLVIANVRANGKDKLPLSDLFTKIEAYLRSLESMGLSLESNSAWLYPMIESSLSDDLLKAWQRYTVIGKPDPDNNGCMKSAKSNLTLLMEFLKGEVAGDERLKLARAGFEDFIPKDKTREKFRKRESYQNKLPTVTGLFNAKELSCLFCSKQHESKDCVMARSLSFQERKAKVLDKNCCLKCLRFGHRAKVCKVFIRCHVCSKPHTELFCPEIVKRKEIENKTNSPEVIHSAIANSQCSREVALMTLELVIKGKKSKKVRALFDSGSQKSYILKSTATELGLQPLSSETIVHTLFGGTQTDAKPHNKFRVELSAPGKQKETKLVFEFLDQEKICGNIPRIPKESLLKELRENKLWVSDIGTGSPEIEILIGSDIYGQLLTGRVKQLKNGMTAIQTKLGWTICGQLESSSQSYLTSGMSMLITNLIVQEMKVPDLWKLETIGITDPSQTLSKAEEEEFAHDHFMKEVTRNDAGRYSVGLPWINGKQEIPCNRYVAERRLISSTQKLVSMKKFEDYDKVFREWEEEDVISKVSNDELKITGHFLPHHPVLKPDSLTTSIRPVFDASCKSGRAPSLNDCLYKGPNLIEQIPAILLRFREKAIAVVADIRRAFLQIEVKESDRRFLRFLWWKNSEEVQVYQHNRVVFGVTSSPFLLSAVIRHHLSNAENENKPVVEKLIKSFYIDNCVTSVDNVKDLENFISKSTEIMAEAKMDLRMWEFGPIEQEDKSLFNNKKLLNEDLTTSVPVLGLTWDRKDDSLKISNKFCSEIENPSKRQILAITQGIFDPIGFLAPALLPAKLMIQEAWSTKLDWDVPLSEKIQTDFKKWYKELPHLNNLKIDRRVGHGCEGKRSIHTFCDASQNAYATAVFLRCEDKGKISVQLLGAKSRLAPKKTISIPRLELLACVLGARLSSFILKALDTSSIPVIYWTDSSTALAWIRRNDQWGTFVGNRVREICKLSESQKWHFVPGPLNPADLPSRGCSPKQLLKMRWWEGPEWLRFPEEDWPQTEKIPNEELVTNEKRKTALVTLACSNSHEFMTYGKYSKFSKFINIICWIKRFILKCRNRNTSFSPELSIEEKEDAEKLLWSRVQLESFGDVTDSIKGFNVMRDQDNILRVKTKILDRDDEFSFKCPILLPSKHHVVNCLIRECHLKHSHAGLQTVGSILREKYWIISSKRNIRSQLSKCFKCKRFSARPYTTPSIHLPLDRVRDSKVFEVVGIDLCGPLFLKRRSKVWIVLFTCAVYRAVHLELVSNLSTECFIQALRRFICRRGRPFTIYSDNGTNFRGTNNLLKSIEWKAIVSSEDLSPIKWKFIPPTAAWWGGWWERLIRCVKNLLVRTLGSSTLNYEEFMTVLCDVEATINKRPLTYLSEEPDRFIPLTPSTFLQEIEEIGVPDLDTVDSKKLQTRYKHCQNIRQQLRNRFRKEYLAELIQKSSEKGQSVRKGDVVLLELSNQKRLHWPIGKIIKIFPSRDGSARVAEVKTNSGTFVRPLRRLYPLEISSSEDPVIQTVNEKTTRSGRVVRKLTK